MNREYLWAAALVCGFALGLWGIVRESNHHRDRRDEEKTAAEERYRGCLDDGFSAEACHPLLRHTPME